MSTLRIVKGSRVRTSGGEVGGVLAVWSENRDEGYGLVRAYGWARVELADGRTVPLPVTELEVVS